MRPDTRGELRHIRIQLRLRLRQCQPRLQASDCRGNDSLRAIHWNRKWQTAEAGSQPHFHIGIERPARMTKPRLQHPHNRIQVTIERHFSPDDVRIRAVIPPPESVADHDRLQKSRNGILLRVHAAQLRFGLPAT